MMRRDSPSSKSTRRVGDCPLEFLFKSMTIHAAAVREMIERVIELSRIYAIWWTLVNKENFEKYSKVIDSHMDFFEATTHSLFQGFSVITYQLFERRKDTTSIPSLIEDLMSSDPALGQQLRLAVDARKTLLGKVFAIRGKVYAHRNKSQPPESVFAAAGLSANEMQSVVAFAQDVVAILGEVAGVDAKAELEADIKLREDFSAEDTRLIMDALQKKAL